MSAAGDATPGTPRREGRGFVPSFGTGRKCGTSGCETTLSRYNDKTMCWVHELQNRTDGSASINR
jgi:hypothetical protein